MHIHLNAAVLSVCAKCGKKLLPHTVCPACGFYKGKEVINVLAKLDKKERKAREKEMKAKEAAEKKEAPKEGELDLQKLSQK